MRRQTAKWVTKAGVHIRLCDMTDMHLINTIKMLRRVGDAVLLANVLSAYQCASSLQGEMASYFAEQDIDRLESMTTEEFLEKEYPIYEKMLIEASRRKLQI